MASRFWQLDQFGVAFDLYDMVDEDARGVHVFRMDLACRHDAIDLGDHLGDLRARIGVCAQKKNSRRIVSDNLRMLAQCGICAKHDLLDGRKNIGRPPVADDDGFQR